MRFKVAELAQQQGFSIRSLAKATNLSYNTVYDLWHNRRWPSKATLEKLADALKVRPEELFDTDQ
jgi:transcriptional regulator with XRE-family HTH domain